MFSFFSRKLTPDTFAQLLQAEFKKVGISKLFEYRKEDFSLRAGEKVFYMKNTFDA